MEGTTTATATATPTAWFLHYCMIFKMRSSHSVTVWIFMKYIGALNVYVDKQPELDMHKT